MTVNDHKAIRGWVSSGLITLAALFGSGQVVAGPIDGQVEILRTFFFNDVRSTNRFFFDDVPIGFFGGYVTPSPDSDADGFTTLGAGTTVSITHSDFQNFSFNIPYNGPIHDPANGIIGGAGSPNEYSTGRFRSGFEAVNSETGNNTLSGWTLNATNPDINGGEVVSAALPDLDPALTPGHVTNVAITGDPGSPNISWALPEESLHNGQSVLIWRTDVPAVDEGGLPTLVHVDFLSAGDQAYAVPEEFSHGASLDPDGQYLISMQLNIVDLDTIGGNTLRGVSRSFFEFTPSAATPEQAVYLPAVDAVQERDADGNLLFDPDGNPIIKSVFHFDVDVEQGQQIFIDPFLAIGYDYEIGINDPLFASFLLPEVGDDLFDLYLFDDLLGDYVFDQVVRAGIEFFFTNPLSKFRILGIETAAGLDPGDPTAFITGLTFNGTGTFTGTMTPISVFVPEPGALSLLLLGFAVVGLKRRTTCNTIPTPGCVTAA